VTAPAVLRADRWLDPVSGEVRSPAVIVVDGNRIAGVNPPQVPVGATELDLGDVTLLPGLMDMELNFLIGGPETPTGLPLPMHGVQDDPAYRTIRGTLNARATLLAGFTTVRNLGLMVKTGGYLLDVALQRAIDQGWVDGPRIIPAGHAITPYGGHLDPTVFQRLAPGIMPLSVGEGIANGVGEVRSCVRYQIRHGAQVIKVSASGGVMSHGTRPGSQQYSDEELEAIADEAHRAGIRVAAHAIGDRAIRACVRAGIDCIEHGFLATDETLQMMAEHGTFLVSTTYLTDAMDIARAAPELQKKAAEVFPRAKSMFPRAIAAGVKIACGTDAPAVPHGHNARELAALVARGMSPAQALRAATVTCAELVERDDELGRLREGYLADIIAVRGDPTRDVTVTQDVRFVMKDGHVYKALDHQHRGSANGTRPADRRIASGLA
jgi:imidazolonepropionase-like amidohydrolase